MRIAGLDVGDKTIGVAVSDPMGWTAQGVTTLRRSELAADLAVLAELLRRHEVSRVVVGLPRNMNGTYGPRTELVRQFGAALTEQIGLPVTYSDERLTTVQAQRLLVDAGASRQRRKQVVDKIAAVLILQSYLDAKGSGSGPQ